VPIHKSVGRRNNNSLRQRKSISKKITLKLFGPASCEFDEFDVFRQRLNTERLLNAPYDCGAYVEKLATGDWSPLHESITKLQDTIIKEIEQYIDDMKKAEHELHQTEKLYLLSM
jgi:hypothetical protein